MLMFLLCRAGGDCEAENVKLVRCKYYQRRPASAAARAAAIVNLCNGTRSRMPQAQPPESGCDERAGHG
jgi:hypothetical protein